MTPLFMAESEELKSLLMKVKEESEKVGLKQHSENEDHGIWSHHFMANRWETVADFIIWGSKVNADGDCSHEIKGRLLLGRKVRTNLVQFSRSVVSNSATPWIAAHQASQSITNSQSLPKLVSIELMMPSSHLILCHPPFLLPSIFPSIRVFSNESTLRMRWPKYWSFSFSIRPSCEHPGLISFRMGWLDLLEVQGTLRSLLQHHNAKASVLQSSAFFTVQLSHPYMTTGKTIALTRQTFVGKVMSLLLNMLSRLVILPSKE